MKYCTECGATLVEGATFCVSCGTKVVEADSLDVTIREESFRGAETASSIDAAPRAVSAPAVTVREPEPAHAPTAAVQVDPPQSQAIVPSPAREIQSSPSVAVMPQDISRTREKKRGRGGFVAALLVGVAAVTVAVVVLINRQPQQIELPSVTYTYLSETPQVEATSSAVKTIYPSLYSTMDSIINFLACCEGGEAEVLIKVEIPGFTQPYEEKFHLTEQFTKIYVRPPLLTGDLGLKSQRDAQIKYSITDLSTGKLIIDKSENITIMSMYDFNLMIDEFGETSNDNLLAWMTPESDGVNELLRYAVDALYDETDGLLEMMVGYQNYGVFESLEANTYYQVLAVQKAMSTYCGIRYTMSSFSISPGVHQRIKFPDETLRTRAGVCIETSLLAASALQSAGFHVMIIFPPGHAQVAVETWEGSGDYFLLETTVLPTDDVPNEYIIQYLTDAQWADYITYGWGDGSGGCYVLDCDFAKELGITAVSN